MTVYVRLTGKKRALHYASMAFQILTGIAGLIYALFILTLFLFFLAAVWNFTVRERQELVLGFYALYAVYFVWKFRRARKARSVVGY